MSLSLTSAPTSTFSFLSDQADPTLLPVSGGFGLDLGFGLDAFALTHLESEPSLVDSSSPSSIGVVSPKSTSSIADATSPLASSSTTIPVVSAAAAAAAPTQADIEALSKHHFERFLHYKALAEEAEKAAALAQSGAFETLLAPMNMNLGLGVSPNPNTKGIDIDGSMLLSYPSQQQFRHQQSFTYDPASHAAQASLAQAQADAHLQAHNAAAAHVHQHRLQHQSHSHSQSQPHPHFWAESVRSSLSFDHPTPAQPQAQADASWSMTMSASPPYPAATPAYVTGLAHQHHQPMLVMAKSSSMPEMATTSNAFAAAAAAAAAGHKQHVVSLPSHAAMMSRGESESSGSVSVSASDAHQKPVLNPHGGGRGYIPGKTPDDPKKRHKCSVCGRGFARAFNLKSHFSTHDPDRSKPHMCPHSTCKRGFSRLHDLERHRQGIHNDGPLVDAKRQGVTPSVARAQVRLQKSTSTTSGSTSASATATATPSASAQAQSLTGTLE